MTNRANRINVEKTLFKEISQLIEQSQNQLRTQIAAKTFERTTTIANLQNLSNNPAIQNYFKDPYFLIVHGKWKPTNQFTAFCLFSCIIIT